MKKLAVGLFLLAAWGFGSPDLEARHRSRARFCEIAHPAYYYQSFGHRRHGRYALGHFRRYHRPTRYYHPGRRHHRRDYYSRGRYSYRPGRWHYYPRPHYRRGRPHFSFYLEF